jgi:hypothetical protein
MTEVEAALTKQANQIKFVAAYALTKTAQAVQAGIKKEIAEKMNLKNTWTERGIRIIPATKDNLQSEVYSKDWYLPQQEEGANRQGVRSGGVMYIPADGLTRRAGIDFKAKVVPKGLRFPDIMSREFALNSKGGKSKGTAKPFLVNMKSGRKAIAVRRTSNDPGFDVLWWVRSEPVKIKPLNFFFEPSDREYTKNIVKYFQEGYARFMQ